MIFASSGDNISPPHQALNWIPTVYPTTRELKEVGQRIVYLLNPTVGHLGIFVSASVARLEHRAIVDSLDDIERLDPGLYEMKIGDATHDPDCRNQQYSVRFEARKVEDIRFEYPGATFERARSVSERNEEAYKAWVSPSVRACSSPPMALALKWLHPMRVSRYAFSERVNPWMAWVGPLAAQMRRSPRGADAANPWMCVERAIGRQVSLALEEYRKSRDWGYERAFAALYGSELPAASPRQGRGKNQ